MNLSMNKKSSVDIEADEVIDIFKNHYMKYRKKMGGDSTWSVTERTSFGGGFSDIYRIENSSGERGILKVLSAKRTVNADSVVEPKKIFSIAYNEIFTMRVFSLLEDNMGASASELNGYFEHHTTYKKTDGSEAEDWIFFIVMPEYETLGKCRISSEKVIYDIALSVLKTLRVLHEPINYKDVYDCFVEEGILSFNPAFIGERDLENYKNFRRVLHNDIKPDNILKKALGDDFVTVLADFGAVCFMDTADGETIIRYGTKPFFDPLVIHNGNRVKNGTTNSDIYSLGITLLSIFYIVGNLPFTKISRYTSRFAEAENRFNDGKDTVNPEILQKPEYISDIFWKIIMKMISHYEWDRFSDANAAIAALTDQKVVSKISKKDFPPEIIAKASLWNLLHENNIAEMFGFIVNEYKRQSANGVNYLFSVLFALVCACNIKDEKYVQTVKEILAPFMDDGRDGAWFAYDMIIMLAKGQGIFHEDSETVSNVRKNLKHLCDGGFLPAVYYYMSQVVQSDARYNESTSYIVKKFDSMLEYPYIPGVRLYRDRLEHNPQLFGFDEETEGKKIDEINRVLKDDIPDYLAVLKYLIENDCK